MANLLQQQGAPMPQGQPVQQSQQMPEKQQPNNQDTYDKFVANAIEIIHSKEMTDSIIDRIGRGKNDSVSEAGMIALEVATRLEVSGADNGVPINMNTIINGLKTILDEVLTVAEAAGMTPMNDEQKYQAYTWAFSNYLKQAVDSGKISQEDLQRFAQMAEEQSDPVPEDAAKKLPGMFGGK